MSCTSFDTDVTLYYVCFSVFTLQTGTVWLDFKQCGHCDDTRSHQTAGKEKTEERTWLRLLSFGDLESRQTGAKCSTPLLWLSAPASAALAGARVEVIVGLHPSLHGKIFAAIPRLMLLHCTHALCCWIRCLYLHWCLAMERLLTA